MILITGATGTIGSLTARLLIERGEAVRSMTRDLSRAPGGEAVQADFEDPRSLRQAFEGVSAALLLTGFGQKLKEHDQAMIEAARAAGVKKVVKLSAVGTGDTDDPGDVRSWHVPGEEAIKASGMSWTMLRPAGFASNSLGWAEAVKAGGPIPNFTGDGAQPIIDPRDIAAVAAAVLTTSTHDSRTYELTGPELLSVPAQVAILAEVLGRPLATVEIPIETAKEQMLASGADPTLAEVAATGWTMLKEVGWPRVSDDVRSVLGRPAASYESWVRDHRAAFS
ncbi:NAD(P)H-binding protein [Nonomuraea guangzhouensis]|uniref:NAD(P)H-binding protein n=1 Tax=Nonomuraea guangzhouensis TaxID=1291555 RepID=A0ABW4GF83_9ACTN|nr:NAD(P)H-binding protein [Nonomuraea guangzhouensis]